MKHIQLFGKFKVNEDMPYNYDYSKNFEIKWTDAEIKDLEAMGASNIKDKSASIDEGDLIVFITKNQKGYKITPNKEIMTWKNPLKSHLRGDGNGPEPEDFDRTKKVPTKLYLSEYYKDWQETKRLIDLIFRIEKFGFDA